VTARPMIIRWISDVPSKIVKILAGAITTRAAARRGAKPVHPVSEKMHEPAADRRAQHLFAQSAEPYGPAPCPHRSARGHIEVDAPGAVHGTLGMDVKPDTDRLA
jgi:hypothetical protein